MMLKKNKKMFKPWIATSLALVFSVDAKAEFRPIAGLDGWMPSIPTCPAWSAPGVCYGHIGSGVLQKFEGTEGNKLKFESVGERGDNGFYAIKSGSSRNEQVNTLILQFGKGSLANGGQSTGGQVEATGNTPVGKFDSSKHTYTISMAHGNSPYMRLESDKGLDMGANGQLKFDFDFTKNNDKPEERRSMSLKLGSGKMGNKRVSLKGDLIVQAGGGITGGDLKGEQKAMHNVLFRVDLDGGIEGNLILGDPQVKNGQVSEYYTGGLFATIYLGSSGDATSKIGISGDFKNRGQGASLLHFVGGAENYIGGNVEGGWQSYVQINFAGKNNTIGGNINGGQQSYIQVNFGGKNNTIGGLVSVDPGGNNSIVFNGSGTSIIRGALVETPTSGKPPAEKPTTFDAKQEKEHIALRANAGTNHIIFNSGTNAITGNIVATGGGIGRNEVLLKGEQSNVIKGDIYTTWYDFDYRNSNAVTFHNTTGNNLIEGTITAGGGNNTITFANVAGSNMIEGNIVVSHGANTISFGIDGQENNATNIIKGNVKTQYVYFLDNKDNVLKNRANEIILRGNRANLIVEGNIELDSTIDSNKKNQNARENNLTLSGLDSILILRGEKNQITNLTLGQGSVIDLSSGDRNHTKFRLLELGMGDTQKEGSGKGLTGKGIFKLYVDSNADQATATLGGIKAQTQANSVQVIQSQPQTNQNKDTQYGHIYSDRLILKRTSASIPHQALNLVFKAGTDYSKIKYTATKGTETAGNIAVATIKNANGSTSTPSITTDLLSTSGFDSIKITLKSVQTDEFGKVNTTSTSSTTPATTSSGSFKASNGFTTYFVDSVISQGVDLFHQEATATALGSTYDLYLANINSLNKRMGELRNNTSSQGAWLRAFNGRQKTDFALQTEAIYTTAQAGYDYAFGSVGANNYVGLALSYANSQTEAKTIYNLARDRIGIDSLVSNAVEVAVYNAYVQDGASAQTGWKNGLYSDTILKMSYLVSEIKMTNQTPTYNTKNFALTLGEEVGYRFLLGEGESWFIDPQAEITLGYLNQNNLKQKLGNYVLDGIQNSVITLRNRVGANFGYKFGASSDRRSKGSVYLGTYYVYDYITGGDINLTTDTGTQSKFSPLASTQRFRLNLGADAEIKEYTRIYFDFEKSFGGKIITDYQINFGLRYSFGQKSQHIPYPKPEEMTKDIL